MRSRQTRFTSYPDPPAPQQFCPTCGRTLIFRHTVVGGVEPPERWDYYDCPTHGAFRYRQRTGRLVPVQDGGA